MPVGDACLLDSNILLRISKSDDPQQAVIGHALRVRPGGAFGSAIPRRRWANSGMPQPGRSTKMASV